MTHYKIRNMIRRMFDNIEIAGQEEILKDIHQSSENKKCIEEKNRNIIKKVIFSIIIILIIIASFVIGIPMLRDNPNTGRTEISLEDIIVIGNEFNPFLSYTPGLHFEFIYDEGMIELIADGGDFCTWDIERGEGPVTDVGTTYTIKGRGHIFWNPSMTDDNRMSGSMSTIKVKIIDHGNVIGLASIQISYDDNRNVYLAKLDKAVEISLMDGNYQKIDQDYIDDFFGD